MTLRNPGSNRIEALQTTTDDLLQAPTSLTNCQPSYNMYYTRQKRKQVSVVSDSLLCRLRSGTYWHADSKRLPSEATNAKDAAISNPDTKGNRSCRA